MPKLEGDVLRLLATKKNFKLPRALWDEHAIRLRAEELRSGGERSKVTSVRDARMRNGALAIRCDSKMPLSRRMRQTQSLSC